MFPSGNFQDSLLRSARVGKTWLLVAIYFTTFGGFLALTSWLPTYWKSYLGVATLAAGSLAGLYSILASLCRVAGGKIADRLGGETTLRLALLVTLAGAILMTLSNRFALSLTAEIILAVGMGVANGAVFKLVPQAVPQAVGGASGWVGGLGAFGGFTLPPVLGVIVATQGMVGYAGGFGLFIGLSLVSLALSYRLRHEPRAVQQPKPIS
jgi:NNP family nitrate/nitrite transporter-like MFS transporter